MDLVFCMPQGHTFSFFCRFSLFLLNERRRKKKPENAVLTIWQRGDRVHTLWSLYFYTSVIEILWESQPVSWPPPSLATPNPHTHTQSIPHRISAVQYRQLPECFQTSNTSQTKETQKINYNTNADPLPNTHTHIYFSLLWSLQSKPSDQSMCVCVCERESDRKREKRVLKGLRVQADVFLGFGWHRFTSLRLWGRKGAGQGKEGWKTGKGADRKERRQWTHRGRYRREGRTDRVQTDRGATEG